MSNALSDSQISILIKPYEQAISDAVLRAWAMWQEAPNREVFCNRTRANMMWDYAVAALQANLGPLPGIHVERKGNTCIFMIGQQLAFRFKKADERGISSNYPTAMALSFHDPEQHVLGIPEAAKAEIVYILNNLETEILHVRLVRREGESVAWSHSLYERAIAKIKPISEPVVAAPAANLKPETSRKRRAVVKEEIAKGKDPKENENLSRPQT